MSLQGPANVELFEGLLMLQHRGQDSAGMVTYDGRRFCEHKDNGLVNDVFDAKTMSQLRGGRRACPWKKCFLQ
jgi:amidophosphoribosyltransferase